MCVISQTLEKMGKKMKKREIAEVFRSFLGYASTVTVEKLKTKNKLCSKNYCTTVQIVHN